jgi:predicted SAM-dependent methyltransferase
MEKRLHLGCLDRSVNGWLNTDVTPNIFVSKIPLAARALRTLRLIDEQRYGQHRAGVFKRVRYVNAAKRLPYADDSFEYAFCAHMLEHLTRDQAVVCVREVCRVLGPGGVFRVVVPDLDHAIRSYQSSNPELFLKLIYEPGRGFAKNSHHWMYNRASLRDLMLRSGFSQAEQCEYQQGRCPDLDQLDNRPEQSLFMEGTK